MTEPVMDSSDYAELESGYSLIKSEDIEESIEEKNGYGMSREEELMISNIKEEEEEGGERQSEEVLREDGVKTEEICTFEWGHEELDEPFSKSNQTERWLSEKGIPEEEEGSLPPVVSEEYNTLQKKFKMAASASESSSGHFKPKHRQEHFSLQRALELLNLIDGDKSDLENLSDNDDAILDADYQPPPREQSSSEDDSSGDEDLIPQPTEYSRGRKRLRGDNNDSGTGTGSDYDVARSHTPRRLRQTQQIEADGSNDGPEEPTPGPSPHGQSNKGRGMRWRATPLTPNLAEFEHEDETEHYRNGWTPLNYFEQYIDKDLIKSISDCSNAMSLTRSGDLLNTSVDEVYHFFGACILMSCVRYPKIRMHWSKALRFTAITDRFTRDRFFKLRQSLKVLIDDDVPEDLRKSDKFWKVRPFLDRILQGCRSQTRPECVSIHEQIIPFTGACPCRQYLPMKPNPVGIKNFICATPDGIVLDFDLYQGTGALLEQVEEPEGLGLGSLVMARLCQTLHRGTKVYCDRFFTSIQGAERIMKKELYMTGTVMKNRVAAAVRKLPTDKTMKNAGRGTSTEVSTEDGKLCVVKWYDNKPVLMMSVVHGTQPEDTCQRWDKKLKQYVSVSRPSIVHEYNLKMGGVDLVDRMISYYRMSARTKKWTMRMLMHFTDLALANSWLLYRKDLTICGAPKKSIMQFLEFPEFEVFVCSLCPFIDMAEEKLHQHIEKVHPEEHIRILGYVGNAAENPGPPGSSHQHPTTSETLLSPTQPHTAGQPSLIGAPRALKTALTSRGMDSARLLKIPSGTVMPLTAAERQRKRRQRLRAEGNYDDYCKRQNEIKRKSRDAQKAREQMLPMSEQIKLVMERRELVKKRVIKHRALKRARAKMTPVGKASPAFNSPCALGKANLKAKRALQHPLPQTPKRKKAVIKIEGDASQSPEKDQATKRPVAALSEETIEAVRLLFARDNISRQAPAGKNVTTV
ncbi:hypothetical protein GJAV_G00072040 [Gymnothorax javanicus]|nr:hypothetical protein GJAV_G00072040 [Gymnothorax javanicus]